MARLKIFLARITHDENCVHDTIGPDPPSLRSIHYGLGCGQFPSCGITLHESSRNGIRWHVNPTEHQLENTLGRSHVAL